MFKQDDTDSPSPRSTAQLPPPSPRPGAAPAFPSPALAGFQQFPLAEAQQGPAAPSLHKNHWGVCSQIIQRMIFACLGSSCHSGVHKYSQEKCSRSLLVPSQESLFAVPASSQWSGLGTINVKPWHSSLLKVHLRS